MSAMSRLLVFLLTVSCPILARAVTIRVQDPNYNNITTNPSSFYFGSCQGFLNNGNPVGDSGCFAGQNETGSAITSITLTFGTDTALQQAGGASASSIPGDLFSSATTATTQDPFTYVLSFTGGALGDNVLFLVTEDGLDPSEFPEVSLGYTNVTPEPPSVLLFGTSLMWMGWLYRRYCTA